MRVNDELRRQFEAAISGMELDELRELAGELLQRGAAAARPAQPELRRPPRSQVAIFRLRVELDESEPPIWRLLDVRSDVTLAVVDAVLQAAFAWQDYHLHRFSLGGGPFSDEAQLFLCPMDVEEGDDGLPDSTVRLDETLQEPGDRLQYVYDYGDAWELTLHLEQVLPAGADAAVATCVDGRRAAPPEDSGGITDEAALAALLDDPAHFDVAEVNDLLTAPSFGSGHRVDPRLQELFQRLLRAPGAKGVLTRLETLDVTVPDPTPDQIAAALHPLLWFLDRAAGDGLELTKQGYLKPADVTATGAILPSMHGWVGGGNREVHTAPVLSFRESLQEWGLLRKYKGRLLLSRMGRVMHGNPAALWDYLTRNLVGGKASNNYVQDATLLVVAYAATSSPGEPLRLEPIAEALTLLGWGHTDGDPIDVVDLYDLQPDLLVLLGNLADASETRSGRVRLSAPGIALARAALRAR